MKIAIVGKGNLGTHLVRRIEAYGPAFNGMLEITRLLWTQTLLSLAYRIRKL